MGTTPKPLIYDLGANDGSDTDFYLQKGFNVVAVEANPLLCAECEKRLAGYIANGRLTVLNIGVADSEGERDFYVNKNHSAWSSFIQALGEREGGAVVIRVTVRTMASLVKQFGAAYYAKIDVEGHDRLALESMLSAGCRPKYVSVENGTRIQLQILLEHGYHRFKFVNQKQVPQQVLPNPPKEGAYVDYKFKFGSSGAFGEETPGAWMSYQDALNESESLRTIPTEKRKALGWFDLHAKLGS